MNASKISAVIICLNEQNHIELCIKSLKWADEVLVYDSGSHDNTVAIAQRLGAKVIQGPWLGFGPTKYKIASLAKNDWILSVDADEVVSEELKVEIQHLSLNPNNLYKIPRLSFFLGCWVRHGGWYPDYQNRLFNRQFFQWNQAPIHEKVESTQVISVKELRQRTVSLQAELHHFVFQSIDQQVQTNNKYSTLQAEKMFNESKNFSWFKLMTKPFVKFVECYIIKLGFLDGWVGYLIARNASYSVFLKWAKLKELKKNARA